MVGQDVSDYGGDDEPVDRENICRTRKEKKETIRIRSYRRSVWAWFRETGEKVIEYLALQSPKHAPTVPTLFPLSLAYAIISLRYDTVLSNR